jgi:hypothetical protein
MGNAAKQRIEQRIASSVHTEDRAQDLRLTCFIKRLRLAF